mmetsp:Transcript_85348/g.222733  ORF Transcript_85348/g.222733 Transcript_85348/m.222733 type:complete len:244 (-) Transcript_85348:1300-2031(-)
MACARVTLQAKPTPAPWPRQAWQFACLSLALARSGPVARGHRQGAESPHMTLQPHRGFLPAISSASAMAWSYSSFSSFSLRSVSILACSASSVAVASSALAFSLSWDWRPSATLASRTWSSSSLSRCLKVSVSRTKACCRPSSTPASRSRSSSLPLRSPSVPAMAMRSCSSWRRASATILRCSERSRSCSVCKAARSLSSCLRTSSTLRLCSSCVRSFSPWRVLRSTSSCSEYFSASALACTS